MKLPVVSRQRIRPTRYVIYDWSPALEASERLTYRPSMLTFLRRLMWSLLIAIVFAPLVYYWLTITSDAYFELPATDRAIQEAEAARLNAETSRFLDTIRDRMSAEEWAAFEAELDQRERQRVQTHQETFSRFEMTRRYANAAGVGAACLLGFFAALGPASCAWQRVSIYRDARGGLAVRKVGLWPQTVRVPRDTIHRISVSAAEAIQRRRHGGISRLGHRWSVSLELGPSGPGVSGDLPTLEFEVHRQKPRPMEGEALPERVARLVRALERMTGLQPGPPVILDLQSTRMGLFGPRWVVAGRGEPVVIKRMIGKPIVRTSTYRHDEIPPELQSQIRDLADSARETGKTYTLGLTVGDRIEFRDADGTTRTYTSPEEMPPDVRAIYEQMRQMARGEE